MATHYNILAQRMSWTVEPGRLYSPWGCKQSDMTERLELSLSKIKPAIKGKMRDFPGGPVVKTSPSDAEGAGSIPGRGTKILQAFGPEN